MSTQCTCEWHKDQDPREPHVPAVVTCDPEPDCPVPDRQAESEQITRQESWERLGPRKCRSCGATDDSVTKGIDPYGAMVGVPAYMWYCPTCYASRELGGRLVISPTVAHHVLWEYGHSEPGVIGFPGGSFTRALIVAIMRADSGNRSLLSEGFPAYVQACDLIETPGGAAALVTAARQVTT